MRSRLRGTWHALVALSLLIGLAGALGLGAWGIARRTGTAFDRMIARTEAEDLLVNPDNEPFSMERHLQIKALPGVRRSGLIVGTAIVPTSTATFQDLAEDPGTYVVLDGAAYDFARPVFRDGRMPDPTDPDEIMVDASYADSHGIHVGDRIDVSVYDGGLWWGDLVTLELVNAVALVPGVRFARTPPSRVLRAE